MASSKPKWLVAGGMGCVGRNLVKYLLDNELASEVRVADKRAPFMAFLSADHKAAIEHPLVNVVQADVSDDEHLDRVFAPPCSGGAGFDVVVNCAAETAHGKSDEIYQKMVDGAAKLAAGAAASGTCKRFVHLSTAQVYRGDSAKAPAREDAALAPWTTQAAYMLRSEEAVRSVAGLPWVILRPATVWGPGDVAGLMPRVVVAASYVGMGRAKMELLWSGDLKAATVHVYDVVRAVYFVTRSKVEPGRVFNLADGGGTDQAALVGVLGRLFGIETGFYGSVMSNLARLKMDTVVNEANEQHLAPWLGLLRAHGIKNTPLSPFLHKQLLQHHHLHVDGSGLEAAGFKYAVPALTDDGLREVVQQGIAQGIFPVSGGGRWGGGGRWVMRPGDESSRFAIRANPPPTPLRPVQPVLAGAQ